MAATIYSPPAEMPKPEFPKAGSGRDWKDYIKEEDDYRVRLQDWIKAHGKGKYAGEALHFPAGDGHATYYVYSLSPLVLIHDPTGDGWHSETAPLMTVAAVKDRVDRERRFQKVWARQHG